MAKLQRRVFGTKHVDVAGHEPQFVVEQLPDLVLIGLQTRALGSRGVCQLGQPACQYMRVWMLVSVVVVVGMNAMATQKVKRHRSHAP